MSRESGYDYAVGAAYSAAMAAMATARAADTPEDADAPWEGDEPSPSFNAGAAEAVADIAGLRADRNEESGDGDGERSSCPDCGADLVDAVGGSVCLNC